MVFKILIGVENGFYHTGEKESKLPIASAPLFHNSCDFDINLAVADWWKILVDQLEKGEGLEKTTKRVFCYFCYAKIETFD